MSGLGKSRFAWPPRPRKGMHHGAAWTKRIMLLRRHGVCTPYRVLTAVVRKMPAWERKVRGSSASSVSLLSLNFSARELCLAEEYPPGKSQMDPLTRGKRNYRAHMIVDIYRVCTYLGTYLGSKSSILLVPVYFILVYSVFYYNIESQILDAIRDDSSTIGP